MQLKGLGAYVEDRRIGEVRHLSVRRDEPVQTFASRGGAYVLPGPSSMEIRAEIAIEGDEPTRLFERMRKGESVSIRVDDPTEAVFDAIEGASTFPIQFRVTGFEIDIKEGLDAGVVELRTLVLRVSGIVDHLQVP